MLAIFHKTIHKSNHAQSMLALCWSLILLSWARNRLCRELLLCLLYFTKLFTRATMLNQCWLCVGLWFCSHELETDCVENCCYACYISQSYSQEQGINAVFVSVFDSSLMSHKHIVEDLLWWLLHFTKPFNRAIMPNKCCQYCFEFLLSWVRNRM